MSASLEMIQATFSGSRWQVKEDRLLLLGDEDVVLREVPLRGGQHVAVNWFSGWRSGVTNTHEVEELLEKEDDWSFSRIFREPEVWMEKVEAGDPDVVEPFRLWAIANDRYNPSVSIAEVLYLYDIYLDAKARGSSAAMALIEEVFLQFKDAYVLIGPTDPLLQDYGPTPFDDRLTPRVAVHGNLIKTVLDGRSPVLAVEWYEPFWAFLLTGVAAVSVLGFKARQKRLWLLPLIALTGYAMSTVVLFSERDLILPFAAPMCSGCTATAMCAGLRLWMEERQKMRLRRLFGTYVSPDVVKLMIEADEDPKLGGNERGITAFFSDIASFTSIAEQLTADQVVGLINTYVERMTAVLVQERGTLDKYIGDAIVGIFNAPHDLPDHAARACHTALGFLEAQQKLCAEWKEDEIDWPQLVKNMRTRVGLHTGSAVVGNMGSSQRFSYTMMGDDVNLAARLEQLGKVYGVPIVVSESTRKEALDVEPDFVFRVLDVTAVKGREATVRIYELVGMRSKMSEQQLGCVKAFEDGFEAFQDRDLLRAQELFTVASKLEERTEEANPSRLYLQRCRQMMDTPM